MNITQLVTYKSGGVISQYDCSNHSGKLIYNCTPDSVIGETPYESGDNPHTNNNFNPIDDIIKHLIEMKSDILEKVDMPVHRSCFDNDELVFETMLGFRKSTQICHNIIDHRRDVHSHTNMKLSNTGLDFASHSDVINYAQSKPDEFIIIDIASDELINLYQSIWNNSDYANLTILVTKKDDRQPRQIS